MIDIEYGDKYTACATKQDDDSLLVSSGLWLCRNSNNATTKVGKPTYTQEMKDNGILPSVGMECLYRERGGINWRKCRIIATLREMVWLDNIDTGSSPLNDINNLMFKPLDTCTDEEKFIQSLVGYNLCTDEIRWKERLIGFIKSNELTGVKWVGK